jgi:hypothetical protein
MARRFLLPSARARALSLGQVARMGQEQAEASFRALRRHGTGGETVCPACGCGCVAVHQYRTRRPFKCQGRSRQFGVTSGATFHARKLPAHARLTCPICSVQAQR